MSATETTILDKARDAIPWLHPNELAKRIGKLEFELGEIVAEHQAEAYRAEAGFPGAASKRDDLAKRRDQIGRDLENARAAVVGADLAAKQRAKAKADKETAERNAKVKKALALRTNAAIDLAQAVTRAVKAYRDLFDANDKAAAILPLNGMDNLTFGHFSGTRLRALVESEIYRLGASASIDGRASNFPGGKPHQDLWLEDYTNGPANIPTLPATIGESERALIKLLDTGQV